MRSGETGKRSAQSARHHVVDDRRAEVLAYQFEGVFGAVDIRETLEGEPVEQALRLLEWSAGKRLPMKTLREKAKKDRLGCYRPKEERPDAAEEHRRYLAFVRRRQAESREERGRSLSREELEALAREFYAPMYRARMETIPAAASEALNRETEEEDDAA